MKAIHTILHDHLSIRNFAVVGRDVPTQFDQNSKIGLWSKEMLKKFYRGRSNLVHNIVTGEHGSIRMSPKVNNNPLFGYFKMNRNQQKLFVHAVLPSK